MFTQCLPAKGKTFEKSDTWVSKYWNVKKRLYDRDDVVLQHWRHLIQKLSRACLPFDADTLHVAVLADVPRIARLLCVRYRQSILSQSRNFESQHEDARIEKIAKKQLLKWCVGAPGAVCGDRLYYFAPITDAVIWLLVAVHLSKLTSIEMYHKTLLMVVCAMVSLTLQKKWSHITPILPKTLLSAKPVFDEFCHDRYMNY